MAFDTTQPTDTTKLRLVGNVIRPNWVAIQDGESTFKPIAINLNNRTVSGPTNDPTAIANTFIVYSKEDAGGNPELYGINESSQVTQLTKGIPTITNQGHTFLAGGLILSWANGTFSNNDTITPSGITTLYQVVITIDDSSATPASRAYVFNITGATFQVKLPSGSTVLRYMVIGV